MLGEEGKTRFTIRVYGFYMYSFERLNSGKSSEVTSHFAFDNRSIRYHFGLRAGLVY
ncbi:MAG: hypothetical protein NUW37_18575 [Planctomycetes bacterium]|nr:hypothetical protein [Planctomycetota bacterium]